MKAGSAWWQAVRISWPVLGGVWGAWAGFGGYLQLPHNADSFAYMFAMGFFIFFAVVGLIAGAAIGALIGGSIEAVMRRFGIGVAAAMGVATVLNALAISQIVDVVQTKYPGLRAPRGMTLGGEGTAAWPGAAVRGAGAPAREPNRSSSCSDPPPLPLSRDRAAWDSECR